MTSSLRDEWKERLRTGPRPQVRARSIVVLAVGALLQAANGACTERSEQRASPPAPATDTSTAGHSATPASRPASAEAMGKRSTRSQMLSHYADTAGMRNALIAGKLADYQAAAAALARDDGAPSAAKHGQQFAQRVRAAAGAAQAAPSLVAAAQALGALGTVCASCHVESGTPQFPIALEEPTEASNPRMLAHAIASDLLWSGLTLASDERWASGLELLEQTPGLADPSPEVSGAAGLLREVASNGKRAEPDERGRVLADVLLTCSGCHERLGVLLENGSVVR